MLSVLKRSLPAFTVCTKTFTEFDNEVREVILIASTPPPQIPQMMMNPPPQSDMVVLFEDHIIYPLVHKLWAPLVHVLLPDGYSRFDEIARDMPPRCVGFGMNALGKDGHRKFLKIPTPPNTINVVNVLEFLRFLLFHFRKFLEYRYRKELWPVLRYHLYMAADLTQPSHNGGGGAKGLLYVTSTVSYKLQLSILSLLFLLFYHHPLRLQQQQPPDGTPTDTTTTTTNISSDHLHNGRDSTISRYSAVSATLLADVEFARSVLQSIAHYTSSNRKQPPNLINISQAIVQSICERFPELIVEGVDSTHTLSLSG
jgi:hypothetical protein